MGWRVCPAPTSSPAPCTVTSKPRRWCPLPACPCLRPMAPLAVCSKPCSATCAWGPVPARPLAGQLPAQARLGCLTPSLPPPPCSSTCGKAALARVKAMSPFLSWRCRLPPRCCWKASAELCTGTQGTPPAPVRRCSGRSCACLLQQKGMPACGARPVRSTAANCAGQRQRGRLAPSSAWTGQ